jgi:hypothetical protein
MAGRILPAHWVLHLNADEATNTHHQLDVKCWLKSFCSKQCCTKYGSEYLHGKNSDET